jgi:integrase
MSKKNSITTCDFINFDEALNRGKKLMENQKTEMLGFYIIVSIYCGLRTSDVKTITYEQLREGVIKLKEQKTNKNRTIQVNPTVQKAMSKITRTKQSGLIFLSQKNTVISTQQVNKLLKEVAFSYLLPSHCISTHSLRKTFGRRVYEMSNKSENSLMYLSELFNHSSMRLTRIYLGIKQEELNDIYLNL